MNSSIKKFFAALLLVSFASSFGFAADDDNDKKFRFGIKVNPMLSWFRPDDKGLEKDGIKAKFGYGLMTEFRLNSAISFATGIGGDYEGGRLNFIDSVAYYVNDEELIGVGDTAGANYGRYLLLSRDYSINYVNVPITLKMKTKDIGGMTYYAVFGGDLGVRTKSKVTDQVIDLVSTSSSKVEIADIDNTKDMNILRTSLNVGGGFEYNLAGSTSLVVGINYRRGFLPAVKKTSDFLQEISNGEEKSFKSTVLGDGLLLTLGVLF